MEKSEKCCGNCCWMFAECTDGDGCCAKHYFDITPNCSSDVCNDYVSNEEKRHYLSVILSLIRWTRDKENHRPLEWEEIMNALEFAYRYIKTFEQM